MAWLLKLKLNEFAWNTVTSIAQKDYRELRLILDEELTYPALAKDENGFVLKIPLPKPVKDEFYQLHGLYFDKDEHSLLNLWRIFKASLYHAALHAAYSDYARYAPWAKGKEIKTATFAVSLIEDYRVTIKAIREWPGIIPDISFANYVAALRLNESVDNSVLGHATKILLALWHVIDREQLDNEVESLVAKVSSLVREHVRLEQMRPDRLLYEAFQNVYDSLMLKGSLRQIPFFPHTESHGIYELFDNKLTDRPGSQTILHSAFDALGTGFESLDDKTDLYESREFFETLASSSERANTIALHLKEMIGTTKLQGIEFPKGDMGCFLG
ncbi:MAG: hypothetical protein QXV84_04520 [Conexivisphaerales archaeon]